MSKKYTKTKPVKTEDLNIRMLPQEKLELKQFAELQGMTASDFVRFAIQKTMDSLIAS